MSLSIRPNKNPNREDYTKQRIRRPLGTKDVNQARQLRDELMTNWNRKEAA
jgi:hypothetical protein